MSNALRTDERTAAEAHSAVSFSRPTSSPFTGKNSVGLKTLVTDEVADDFHRFARDRGYSSTSDALRDVLLIALYGPDYLTDLHRKRIEALACNMAGTVPAGARG